MQAIQQKLAHRLIHLRNERHMTQTELAEAAGLTVEAVSRIERSKRIPRLGSLVKLAEGLGVTLSELLDFEDHRARPPAYKAQVRKVADLLSTQPAAKVRLVAKIAELVIKEV